MRLWTWRRAQPGYVPNSPVTGLYGHWSDAQAYRGHELGSRLYQLIRAPKTTQTLRTAENIASEALADLITLGVASQITPTASWIGPNFLGLQIVVQQPDGSVAFDRTYNWAWQTLSVPTPEAYVAMQQVSRALPAPVTTTTFSLGSNFILGETPLGNPAGPPASLGIFILGANSLG